MRERARGRAFSLRDRSSRRKRCWALRVVQMSKRDVLLTDKAMEGGGGSVVT